MPPPVRTCSVPPAIGPFNHVDRVTQGVMPGPAVTSLRLIYLPCLVGLPGAAAAVTHSPQCQIGHLAPLHLMA